MWLKEFLSSKIFFRNMGLAVILTIVFIWFTMTMLSFYTNKGDNFPTPDFKGLTIAQVNTLIDDHDFRFVIEDSVYSKDFTPGSVVFQNPAAGHKIKPNRLIYITVASHSPEQVEVPKLTDVSIRQARELLESKGFGLGTIMLHPSEFDDLVLEQKHLGRNIAPGAKLPNGSSIDLVVGKHMTGGETTVPDLKLVSLAVAQSILRSRGLNTGSVIFDSSVLTSGDTLNAIIWKQDPVHDSTTLVMPGISVDLWLKLKSESNDSITNNPSGI